MTESERNELRRRYQTNLWLMATELCDVPLRPIHREICEFFIQKDPDKPIEQQSTIRERLLLFPRHGWKTTIDALDAVNWIINFPLVRVAIQTGDSDLAKAIVGTIKSYFTVSGWDGERDARGEPIWNDKAHPTMFQRLFTEHCVCENDKGAEDYFITPARKNPKWNKTGRHIPDPTVYAISIESATSGWRCDVLKNDDILTDQNIRSSQRVVVIHRRFNMSHKLLPKWGYRDTIGTRYENDDTYGKLMFVWGIGQEVVYGNFKDEVKGFHYLCRPAWWLKGTGPDGVGELQCKYFAPTLDSREEDCEYLDTEIWDFKFLHDDMLMDPKVHSGQYLNNPTLAGEVDFTREGLLKCFIDWTQMPVYAKTFAIADLAYSDKRGRDFTVIAIGAWHNEALWIKDIIRGRFRPEEMPESIVSAIRDYPEVQLMGIEESVGARWLKTDIYASAERQGIKLPQIVWIPLGQGEKNAKENRIKGLVPLYKNHRLFFASNMQTEVEEVIREFISSRGKRDIPDAISRFVEYAHQGSRTEDKKEAIDRRRQAREQAQFDMIFGQGAYAYVEPPAPVVEPEPEDEIEYDEVTGLPIGDFYGSQRY
jgi:hypothetical protein